MAEELKSQMRKIENLIGCKKVDITEKSSTEELIEALNSKYKADLQNSVRLHRLEFYRDLIEDARKKRQESVDFEEKFLLAKESKEDAKKEDKDKPEEFEEEKFEKPDEVVKVPPEDIDEWKNLMTLSKIYYVLEHPMSEGLTWERRVKKKKHISKFTDKDLIEWRVAQNFQLKDLEEWALSRSEARKLAEESPFDFDDLLDDDESRELEDMFNILKTQKQKKADIGVLEKLLHTKRPFKFKDEGMEDWTESYSDDSEQSDAGEGFYEMLEFEESDLKLDERKEKEIKSVPSLYEDIIDEEEIADEVFSSFKDISKYRRPIFEKMEETKNMNEWWTLCHEAVGEGKDKKEGPPEIKITSSSDDWQPIGSMSEIQASSTEEGISSFPYLTLDEASQQEEDLQRLMATKSDIQLMVAEAQSDVEWELEEEIPATKMEEDLDFALMKDSDPKLRMDMEDSNAEESLDPDGGRPVEDGTITVKTKYESVEYGPRSSSENVDEISSNGNDLSEELDLDKSLDVELEGDLPEEKNENSLLEGDLSKDENDIFHSLIEGDLSGEENYHSVIEGDLPEEKNDHSVKEGDLPEEENDHSVIEGDLPEEENDHSVIEGDLPEEENDHSVLKGGLSEEEHDHSVIEGDLPEEEHDHSVLEGDLSEQQNENSGSVLEEGFFREEQKENLDSV